MGISLSHFCRRLHHRTQPRSLTTWRSMPWRNDFPLRPWARLQLAFETTPADRLGSEFFDFFKGEVIRGTQPDVSKKYMICRTCGGLSWFFSAGVGCWGRVILKKPIFKVEDLAHAQTDIVVEHTWPSTSIPHVYRKSNSVFQKKTWSSVWLVDVLFLNFRNSSSSNSSGSFRTFYCFSVLLSVLFCWR